MLYHIHRFKTDGLTPDEQNSAKRGGIWLYLGEVEAADREAAKQAARAKFGLNCPRNHIRVKTNKEQFPPAR